MKQSRQILIAAVTATLAACATTPQTVPELEQARTRVQSLAENPGATGTANRDLTAARAALARAEEERQRILLQSREREAAQARQAAQTAEQQAQTLREAELQARAELESLQQEFASLQAEQTNRGMVLTLGDVLFDVDEATLKPGAESTIDRLAEFLQRNEAMRIRIEGHTDSTGSEEYNRELSRERAQAVADALAAHQVPPSRVAVLPRGESYPVASNATAAGRQENRRVEIVFSNETGSFVQTQDAPPETLPPPGG